MKICGRISKEAISVQLSDILFGWQLNAESCISMPYQITDLCTNCGECLRVCPLEAILPGEKRPRIDPDLCTDCGTCSDICPARAIEGG
jgi:ferredoxin